MDKYILYHDLRDAIQHDHCPVCRLLERRIERTIKVLLREGAGDGILIRNYVRARGYCNAHAWQVKEAGDPASQAAFYRALLEEHRKSLALYVDRRISGEGAKARDGLRRVKALLQGSVPAKDYSAEETLRYLDSFASEERCPICVVAESSERRYIEAIADYYEHDEEFRERYRNRGLLCHPHLRRLVREQGHRQSATELMDIQLSRIDLQIEHLREIERRANIPCSEESSDAYKGGWIRAIRLDVGIPGTDTGYKRRRSGVLNGSMIKP